MWDTAVGAAAGSLNFTVGYFFMEDSFNICDSLGGGRGGR